MLRLLTHRRELGLHQLERRSRTRAEPELLVEPPRAALQRLFVVVTELVRIDRVGIDAEQAAHGREHSAVDPPRFAAAERVEHVVGDLCRTEERAVEHVADRRAVLQREERIHGFEQQPTVWLQANRDELQAVLPVDDAHVARIAVCECVEVALARDHRVARELDVCGAEARRHAADRARAIVQRLRQRRPLRAQRPALERDLLHRRLGNRARRRVLRGRESHPKAQRLERLLEHERIAVHRMHATHDIGPVGCVRPLLRVDPLARRERHLVHRHRLRPARQQRQLAVERLHRVLVPADGQLLRPTFREAQRRRSKERIRDRRAGDARVRERAREATQVGSLRERVQHPQRLQQHDLVVGVGAHEAEQLVESHHGLRAWQRSPFETLQKGKANRRRVRRELVAHALQRSEHGHDRAAHRRAIVPHRRFVRHGTKCGEASRAPSVAAIALRSYSPP